MPTARHGLHRGASSATVAERNSTWPVRPSNQAPVSGILNPSIIGRVLWKKIDSLSGVGGVHVARRRAGAKRQEAGSHVCCQPGGGTNDEPSREEQELQVKRRSQFPMIEQQVRDSGDGKVDDLGRRPTTRFRQRSEDSNVERRRAPDDPETPSAARRAPPLRLLREPQLSGRVVDHHVRPDPQDGTGGKGKHLSCPGGTTRSPMRQANTGRNSRQHHRNGVETDSPGPATEAPQCHHIRPQHRHRTGPRRK